MGIVSYNWVRCGWLSHRTTFTHLVRAVREAVEQLDKILDAGMWDEGEPEDAPPTIIEHFRRHRFSEN